MSAIKIDKKIVKYRVQKPADKQADAQPVATVTELMSKDKHGRSAKVIRMTEEIQRPEVLIGSTYKIKTPVSDHAMYVTINDIVLNEGTDYEQRRPFEVFINSKNLDHFQWIVALTRIISAVFRKGGDITFLVDELKAVFDPQGRLLAARRQVHALDHRGARLTSSSGTCRPSASCGSLSSTSTSRSSWTRSAPNSRRAPSRRTLSPSPTSRTAPSSAPSAAPPPS